MTQRRPVVVFWVALPLLTLTGCNPHAEPSEAQKRPEISPEMVQEMRKQMSGPVGSENCPAQVAQAFATKAPPHSSIDNCNRELAVFTVSSRDLLGREGEPFQIALATDGRFEYILKRDLLTREEIVRVQEEWRRDMSAYERFPGYQMYFWGPSVGTRMSDGWQIRHVRYWNERDGIFCLGTSSSDMTMHCLWGTPQERYQVGFSFDDLKPVLEYLGKATATLKSQLRSAPLRSVEQTG